ncbi:MAG: hypothetical protein ACC612_12975 [Methanomethylovorans sp.]|uniref:hypothetical protein n=1 Tax=Methanomethylovorans sp. TaxID=2758717 RepID=UPI0035308FCD
MSSDKMRVFYISSLLVLATIIIIFAQGVFSGLSTGATSPMDEITRTDLYDGFLGNHSFISVKLTNNDTVSHKFSINTFFGEELADTFNTTVNSSGTLEYGTYIYPEEIPISQNDAINSTLRVAKLVVYMDEQPEPIKETSFIF